MKTSSPLLAVFGVAAGLLGGGCSSVPLPGDLVYYDGGSCWSWGEESGWSYLGERQFGLTRNHVPRPLHPPEPGRKHHPPGHGKPSGGSGTCYFFFERDGSVLESRDGSAFREIGRLGKDGHFIWDEGRSDPGSWVHGAFDRMGSSFQIKSDPGEKFRAWLGNAIGAGSGRGESGIGYGGGSSDRGSYSGGGGDRSSGSSGGSSGASSSWGGGGGGGGFSGGGGGRESSGGGGRDFSGGSGRQR